MKNDCPVTIRTIYNLDTVFLVSFTSWRSGKTKNDESSITRCMSDGLVETDGRVHAPHVMIVST